MFYFIILKWKLGKEILGIFFFNLKCARLGHVLFSKLIAQKPRDSIAEEKIPFLFKIQSLPLKFLQN